MKRLKYAGTDTIGMTILRLVEAIKYRSFYTTIANPHEEISKGKFGQQEQYTLI